jgi:hypothetical protein
MFGFQKQNDIEAQEGRDTPPGSTTGVWTAADSLVDFEPLRYYFDYPA